MTESPESRGPSAPPPEAAGAPAAGPRRRFLAATSIVLGSVAGLVPLAAGLWTFLAPLTRRRTTPLKYAGSADGPEGFVRICQLDALPVGAAPQRFPVVADLVDGWNYVPRQPVGAVFLQQIAPADVRAFNATCPHAGCSVAFERGAFHCPCHNSAFSVDGAKLMQTGKENPSPRGLDQLEVDPRRLAAGEVWVRFDNFYTGVEQKIPKT